MVSPPPLFNNSNPFRTKPPVTNVGNGSSSPVSPLTPIPRINTVQPHQSRSSHSTHKPALPVQGRHIRAAPSADGPRLPGNQGCNRDVTFDKLLAPSRDTRKPQGQDADKILLLSKGKPKPQATLRGIPNTLSRLTGKLTGKVTGWRQDMEQRMVRDRNNSAHAKASRKDADKELEGRMKQMLGERKKQEERKKLEELKAKRAGGQRGS